MGDTEREKRLAELDNQKRDMVKELWRDIDSQLGSFREADVANRKMQKISKAAEKGSPAAQLSLIFNFMKVNDPGSVVREGEFDTAAKAKAFLEKVDNGQIKVNADAAPGLAWLRQVAFGQKMTDTQVRDFMATSNNLFSAQQQNADMIIRDILDRANSEGLSPERVIGKERYAEWQKRQDKEKPQQQAQPQQTGAAETAQVTATNPQTGQKIIFVNGQWLDMQTRQPLQ